MIKQSPGTGSLSIPFPYYFPPKNDPFVRDNLFHGHYRDFDLAFVARACFLHSHLEGRNKGVNLRKINSTGCRCGLEREKKEQETKTSDLE